MDNDFYKKLLLQSPFGYAYHKILFDENQKPIDYIFLEINDAFINLTGLNPSNIINKKVTEIIPGIENSEFDWISFYADCAINGTPKAFDQFSEHLNRWYKVEVYSPEKFYFITLFTDITLEKKQTEELEKFFDINLDLLCIADLDGNFVKVNKAWENLLGYSINSLEKKKFLDFIHPDDLDDTLTAIDNLKKESTTLNFTNRYLSADGSYRIIEWRSRLEKNLIYASARDLTSQKEIENELKLNEIKLNALFSAMTEMVVLHDLVFDEQGNAVNYRLIDCNNSFTKITGITRESILGKLATEVYGSENAPYLDEFSKVALSGEPFEFYTFYPAMDKHFMISVVSPGKNQFATITTDVTSIKQTEDLIQAKNRELENYLYVASHDLRSPLVNIQGFGNRIEKQVKMVREEFIKNFNSDEKNKTIISIIDNDIKKSISFIFNNVYKMDVLVNGLLTISRTGRVKMSIQQIDMNNLVKRIIESLSFQIDESKAKFEVSELPVCYGDQNLLNQLFSNLIGNSLKYKKPDVPPIIKISGQKREKRIVYSITDNGLGIDKINIEKIWQVFYRVDPTASEKGEGIGLNIASKIVEKHKGKIWVDSEKGVGTTFFIELLGNIFTE
ncbi:MAG: PAS domain S-box protein [Ignavibacteriaceae bacterium]|nr:PAS domain S-box protein [Ignavibacteriaceae bacterium]